MNHPKKILAATLLLTTLFMNLTGCGKDSPPPIPSQVSVRWTDAQDVAKSQDAPLAPSPADSSLFVSPQPVHVQFPIKGSASFSVQLPNVQLPSKDFSNLHCEFKVDQAGGKTLGTGISTPWFSDALSQDGSTGKIDFTVLQLDDSINQIQPGRKFTVTILLKPDAGSQAQPLQIRFPINID